jgi:hypothetical protein
MGDRKAPTPPPTDQRRPAAPPAPPAKRFDSYPPLPIPLPPPPAPPPPPRPQVQQEPFDNRHDEIERLACLVVERVISVYREDYIERCVRNEPDSLLALVKRLESALYTARE